MHHDEILFELECEFVLGKPWCSTDCVDPAAVAAIEAAVGRPMPALLKQVYLKLGDGHVFRDKLLSLGRPSACAQGVHAAPLLEEYHRWSRTSQAGVRFLVPLAGGCGRWTLADYEHAKGPLWSWDGQTLTRTDVTLARWLSKITAAPIPDNDPWACDDARDPLLPPGAHPAVPPGPTTIELTDDEIIARIRAFHASRALPAPATLQDVAAIEALVGHPMPPLLRRLYLEVSNGHFDDRASIFRLVTPDELEDDDRGWEPESVMDAYPAGSPPQIPASVVPLRYWGCSVFTHVDWSTPEGRIWGEDEGWIFPERFTLAERLIRWMDGFEDFPQPLRDRGRPIHYDDKHTVISIHDNKTWKITESCRTATGEATHATVTGPLPCGGTGESQVIISYQPQRNWYWMDLAPVS